MFCSMNQNFPFQLLHILLTLHPLYSPIKHGFLIFSIFILQISLLYLVQFLILLPLLSLFLLLPHLFPLILLSLLNLLPPFLLIHLLFPLILPLLILILHLVLLLLPVLHLLTLILWKPSLRVALLKQNCVIRLLLTITPQNHPITRLLLNILTRVSNQTRNLINLPNSADPAREQSNLTPVMVGGRSQPPKLETGESVDGFEHENHIFNRPDRKMHQKLLFAAD